MNTSVPYTPLECLLLFQSLATHGAEDHQFDRISSLLTNNSLVKDGETYHAQRLSADALRTLYLGLLGEELRAEEQDEQEEGAQSLSKKRKAPTPSLRSVKDALEYAEKLPQLVDRLYARYRENMVAAIVEDERRYAVLRKEIQELEWEASQESQAGINNGGKGVSGHRHHAASPQIPQYPQHEANTAQVSRQSHPEFVPSPLPRSESRPDGLAISDVLNRQEPPIASPRLPDLRSMQNYPSHNTPPLIHQRTGSNGPAAQSPFQPPPGFHHPNNGVITWDKPLGPHQQPPPYQSAPYPQYQNAQYPPPQPYPPQRQGSFQGSHVLPHPHPHVPSSPINAQHSVILPPPNPSRSPSVTGMPLNALADIAGQHQQYRHPSGSPLLQQGPMHYQQPYNHSQQRSPSGNVSLPPQWNHNSVQNPQYTPPYPQQYPQAQHIQHPSNQRPVAPFVPPSVSQLARGYESPYPKSQVPIHPASRQLQGARGLMIHSNSLPSTPFQRGRPPFQTGSGTRWTPQLQGTSTPRSGYTPVPAPEIEPLSPVLPSSKLPETETMSAFETTPKPVKKAPKKSVKSKPPPRGAPRMRAGSNASSVLVGSQRSQSVMSHADEMSVDSRAVKEEVATPSGLDDAGDTTADELPRLSRRATVKRKRGQSTEPRPESSAAKTVRWTRAFPKISASALESITGHKNASTFAAPVKERDAPGYSKIIKRPQDLKSIRSAISAGQRAASAAAPADINPNDTSIKLPISEDIIPPRGIVNYSQFEKEAMRMFANAVMFNPDPDRGLGPRWRGRGNGHLGEDSLGYEIDEDGVVNDTKEMFADAEDVIMRLRAAERKSEDGAFGGGGGGMVGKERDRERESSVGRASTRADEDEDRDTADAESHAGTAAKRRRKA